MEQSGAKFEGWAVVELFGHQREVGFVTTQYFGDKAMFQLDVPELPERELEIKRPQYLGSTFAPAGTKVSKAAIPGRSRLISPGAVYALNPCSQDFAMQALDEMTAREIKIIELAKSHQITEGEKLPGEQREFPDLDAEEDRSEMEPTDEELEGERL